MIFAENEKDLETIIQIIRIYSQDIEMEFWIEKSAMFIIKKGKEKQWKSFKYSIKECI